MVSTASKVSKVRLILTIFLFASLLATGAFLYINNEIQKGLRGELVKPFKADIRIAKARYVETRDGRKEWELEADSAQYFKENNLTLFQNVRVVFYSENGANYTLEGQEGRLKNDTKEMDISGDVVATSADGYTLKTDSLQYNPEQKQISTKDRLIFTGPNIEIEGIGFVADIRTEMVHVEANVRTVLKNAEI